MAMLGRPVVEWNSRPHIKKGTDMDKRILVSCGCSVLLLGWITLAIVSAQPVDKRTFFTFSAPVAVPGVTLPPGKYIFRIVDPTSGGKVVQVVSADGTKPYAMFFAIPAERLTPAEQPEIRFMETPEGVPPAIKTWWSPGETIGREFIYPKEQARQLAKNASSPVLTTERQTTTIEQTNTDALARISSTGQESPVKAGDKPTPSAPGGSAHEGEAAPESISIKAPRVPTRPGDKPK
jgi:hypothetical protein